MFVHLKERTVSTTAEITRPAPACSHSFNASGSQPLAQSITDHLMRRIGPRKYGMWFGNARMNIEGLHVEVATESPYVARWIDSNFAADLHHAAVETLGQSAKVDVRVAPEQGSPHGNGAGHPSARDPIARQAQRGDDLETAAIAGGEHGRHANRTRTRRGGSSRRSSHWRRLDEFVVGDSNRLAYSAACRIANPDDDSDMAVLFVHGECGVGKTHLIQGAVQRWIEHTGKPASARYVTGEQFTNEFISAIRDNSLDEFRRRVRKLDLLAIDDVHFLANKVRTQSEFLYTLDAIGLAGARIVLASDNHPRHIKRVNQALVSRFLSGMVVQVERPDRQTRVELVRRLAAARGLALNDAAADTVAGQCVGSVRELEGAITRLAAVTTLLGEPGGAHNGHHNGTSEAHIGAVLASQAFRGQSAHPAAPIRLAMLIDVVCNRMGVTMADLTGAGRHRRVVQARAIVAYLARELTTHSYPEIARAVGRNYHSTVHTADQRLRKQLGDGELAEPLADGRAMTLRELVDQLQYEVLKSSARPG
jgi:chromosomal replication initiator protein